MIIMKKHCKKYANEVDRLTQKLHKLEKSGECNSIDETGWKYRSTDCKILDIQLNDAKNELNICKK